MAEPNQAFMHASEPQPVSAKRSLGRPGSEPRYRADLSEMENEALMSNNIMFDRRVVRGNTYAAQVVTQNAQREVERLRQENERAMRREALRRRREMKSKPRTPPPVDGRTHADAQTENYLEELTDRPVEVQAETQTEPFLDRPPSPLFMPAKSGVDKDTQIGARDLFDFDLEVKPILEVLVGKTLQVSMLELMEEEELEAIHKRQMEFEQMRNAELMEVQRLEAEASRRYAEKQRRLKQEKERKRLQEELQEKVSARSFAKNYLADLSEAVFTSLEETGHFYDPVHREVDEVFMPWLMAKVVDEVGAQNNSRALADELVKTALMLSKDLQEEAARAREAELVRLAEEKRLRDLEEAKAKALAAEGDAAADGADADEQA